MATADQNILAVQLLGLKGKTSSFRSRAFFYCPWHRDTKPSLSIEMEKGIWHCFSCDRSGTLNSLSRQLTGKSQDELLGIKSSPFNIYQNHYKPEPPPPVNEDNMSVEIRGVLVPFQKSMQAIEYLKERKIDLRIAASMDMKFTAESYVAGTRFQNRLIIPIYNSKGTIINVEGRDVGPDPFIKCLYPRGSHKTLYEHYKLDKKKTLYVTEGLMDLAVLRKDSFFENSSSIFGVSITQFQLDLLNQFKKVVLIPDNDEAGEKSVGFLRENLSTSFSVLRIGSTFIKDIGDIPVKLKQDIQSFRKSGGFLRQSFSSLVFGFS